MLRGEPRPSQWRPLLRYWRLQRWRLQRWRLQAKRPQARARSWTLPAQTQQPVPQLLELERWLKSELAPERQPWEPPRPRESPQQAPPGGGLVQRLPGKAQTPASCGRVPPSQVELVLKEQTGRRLPLRAAPTLGPSHWAVRVA